ncbi:MULTISPECIES: UDP-glucose dehydrogenase family protein [Phyllobacteriaceae]|jgi:UDPglucose 6-dehydrogenase|uniref:UDP-glucose 6-dehydrogenase n=1 Tax=Mesorhizobium hungaricum TaxID=1566387 RepID=A0A1C2DPE8_9HYPH|nr:MULTISPECIES: UDP-glucose/GDP-mannose dehydrogenase family protein [Mesorhizobium]MBN9233619.1 UDP-glucose/GDP-mannose dehydrogenase family protein [Mesorhizobium sp.]MDQ0328573.1 UDPglucose 6-dehydrogenase [Mesorhizobium sp. YL-MeA3-2017]OCX16619.1 UDP-glucose 6-dehydrogenase [Mesorhizobium hungaricum]
MKIAVIGTGYVGLVSGTCFAEWGHDVVCVDKNADKISRINNGQLPIYEPDLDILVARNREADRLSFTCDLASAITNAQVVFIAVGTPSRVGQGDADLSFVYMAAREMAPFLAEGAVVAVKSTVPVGTGDAVEKIIASVCRRGSFSVASNPEFLREGVAIGDFLKPDRVVIGAEDGRARAVMLALYREPLGSTPLVVTDRCTAELIKYAANAFLATKITFINELADLCERVGSNVGELALGIGLDKRIGNSFLNAGPGYGGSCFPKDTLALLRIAQDYGVVLRIVEETIVANEARKRKMALKVVDAVGGDVDGQTIAVLGLTFKPDTDDMREAPAVPLIETLQRYGATVRGYDPVGNENASCVLENVALVDDPYECARDADAVVVVTEWDSIRRIDLSRLRRVMRRPVLVDLRSAFEPGAASAAGFRVSTIGQRPERAERLNLLTDDVDRDTSRQIRSRQVRGK